MCGIVGYIGFKEAKDFLIEGLEKLEYRGYDSSGIGLLEDGKIKTIKCEGRLKNLQDKLEGKDLTANIGIGHTRWATHGEPSSVNSHPHSDNSGNISVVHNGIIENYLEIKEWLKGKGVEFKSQTDTEVIPNLISYYYDGDLLDAVIKATEKLTGSYALAVISSYEADKIIAVRKDNPLVIGLSKNEFFIASDIPALLDKTRSVYILEDNEYSVLTTKEVKLYDKNKNLIDKKEFVVDWDIEQAEKEGFPYFMLKEIHEQPNVVAKTLNKNMDFKELNLSKEYLKSINKIQIVACGTAYHAGLVGKYAIEELARIRVDVDVASEFRYKNPIIDQKTLMIVVSQSGETADTIASLREGKSRGAKVIGITNVVGSTISRECDGVVYTLAGPEIAVASTKAYETQIAIMYALAIYLAKEVNGKELKELKEELLSISKKVQTALNLKDDMDEISKIIEKETNMFFIGRGIDYSIALEASLKLKEISYIHSEAYASGELKHGPIALIEEGTKVVALCTQSNLIEKTISNIKEVKARGAYVISIAFEGEEKIKEVSDKVVYIPKVCDILSPLVSIVPLQLLSYYTALNKGLDVDKPRNLAKSVTVE